MEVAKTTLTRCGKRKVADEPNLPQKRADHPYLPEELIFENIMTRVPSSTLMRCVCVSKLWYKSILDDSHFATAYFAQQSKMDPPFTFYIFNVPKDEKDNSSKFPNRGYIFRFEKRPRYTDHASVDLLRFDEKHSLKSEISTRIELLGNCNGLVCLLGISGSIWIVNPSRSKELLIIFRPPIIKYGRGYVCCYGFGFDSLTNEYKVVLIVVKKSVFKCLVFTLGTNSWRETSTTIPLSPVTTTSFYKSAIFCGGALFWRTKSSSSDNNNMLLLSFDLHDDEFQVIRLPAECASSSLLEQQHQIIDPLLVFKGSPCVARLEKTILGGGNCTSTTSYCYKVHLHILKEYNKVGRRNEQVWIKETFNVAPLTFTTDLSAAAPCFPSDYFRPPPNRIMSLSDGRVFLYCFRLGQVIQIYDLQTKRLTISNCGNYTPSFMKKKHSEVYDQIDYHLSGGHIENFMSMLAFIPKGGGEGAPPRLSRRELISIVHDKQRTPPPVGYLRIQQKNSADHFIF